MNDSDIRKRLNEIDCKDRREHSRLIEQLKLVVPEVSNQLVRDCTGLDDNYICHLYTFGIPQNSTIFLQKQRVFPIIASLWHCTVFDDLRQARLIEEVADMKDADIIVYYHIKDGRHSDIHSGQVHGEFVISKWGRGHVWKHRPQHVASVFEDNGILRTKFFKNLNSAETMEYFEKKASRF